MEGFFEELGGLNEEVSSGGGSRDRESVRIDFSP